MYITYRQVDADGFYLDELVSDEELNDDLLVRGQIPYELFRPRWNGEEWVEDMTESEINEILAENEQQIEITRKREAASRHLRERQITDYLLNDEVSQEDKDLFIILYDAWQPGKGYIIGDTVTYDNKVYRIIQPHTSQSDWLPIDVPALYVQVYQTETDDGTEVIPDFVQPTGDHDAYRTGDKVLFESKVYVSLIDNNVWSPADYPQGWGELNE